MASKGGIKIVKKSSSAPNLQSGPKPNSAVPAIKESAAPPSLSPLESADGMIDFAAKDLCERSATIEQLLVSTLTPVKLADLIAILKRFNLSSPEGNQIMSAIITQVNAGTEKGVGLLNAILKKLGRTVEPLAVPLLSKLLHLHADRSQATRDLAASCAITIASTLCPQSFRIIFPVMMDALAEEDWRIKVGVLELLKVLATRVSKQLSPLLPQLIPQVSECMVNSKKQVQVAGIEAMTEACKCISNEDIHHLVPQLVSVIARPEDSPRTLDLLLETTFVANVDAPTLALIAPLLGKILRGRLSGLKRKAAKVIDSMVRLVVNPSDVAPFVPMLLPALERTIEEIVDQEVCEVIKSAVAVLLKAMGEGNVDTGAHAVSSSATNVGPTGLVFQAVEEQLRGALATAVPESEPGLDPSHHTSAQIRDYIAKISANLVVYDAPPNTTPIDAPGDAWRAAVAMTASKDWNECIVPYAKGLRAGGDSDEGLDAEDLDDQMEKLASAFRLASLGDVPDFANMVSEEDSNVCNIEFSLAFGGKILLHNTYLRLGRGKRYALMGKNGAGKTTLLTNIGSGNIEGMPAELKTVYVQHDDATEDQGVSMIDELLTSADMVAAAVTRDEAVQALKAIRFTDTMLTSPRSNMSGGWKMKLLIIKAMLAKADILLLDEPTNHLDAASVAWLVDYLNAQTHLTCLIVSHDTAFLDQVISDVIHYEGKKLVYYHGNLTEFVRIHPEAKYYYELAGSTLKFIFPVPERLEGINSVTRSVLKMDNITYTYPGASQPQLRNCSVKLCLGSRVAVVGANGAGKSTLIRLLVQETQADEGTGGEVWKHINLRLAYVAQHSFHHIEQHLEVSPVDYIKWRFSGGVDKEDLARPTMKLTEEEVQEKKGERRYGDVDEIVGRRKSGRTMEYECTFIGQIKIREPNKYIAVETLIEMGHGKLVQQMDAKVAAAAAGLDLRPLLTAEIQRHLDDFALEAEFGTHGTIRRMSGGQKVKLVLAAAMWNKPHILVLDEPTNYLDREALGALTQAIKAFAGGVIMISHNKEFTDAICNETWLVENGICTVVGGEIEDAKVKATSAKEIKRSRSNPTLKDAAGEIDGQASGNINSTVTHEVLLNPKTLEKLSKKETRKLERCAEVAGVSLKEYVSKIKSGSPEWAWL